MSYLGLAFFPCLVLKKTPFFQTRMSTIMQNQLEGKGNGAYKDTAHRMSIPNSYYILTVMNKQTLAITCS